MREKFRQEPAKASCLRSLPCYAFVVGLAHTTTMRMPSRQILLLSGLVLCGVLAACSHRSSGPPNASQTRQQARAAEQARNTAREQLDEIPPPSKSRYLPIHTLESWNNPFLIVSRSTVTLRVMNPEPPASTFAPNGILRPVNARRNELDLHLSQIPEALTALPEEMWPYGRVIAVEEDPAAPRKDRPQVRRNVETVMKLLTDLGVEVDEWPNNGLSQ